MSANVLHGFPTNHNSELGREVDGMDKLSLRLRQIFLLFGVFATS
jgi:hypothetical protein